MILIGLTTPATAETFHRRGTRVDGVSLRVLQVGQVAAVLAALPRNPLGLFSRKSGLKELVRLQRILEALMPHGPLLAARPGTRVDDEATLRTILQADQCCLVDELRTYGYDIQYQIIVHWDGPAVLAADPAIMSAVAAAARDDAKTKGTFVSHVRQLRDGLQARLEELLAPVIQESILLPLECEDMVANVTVRVARGREAELEAALQPLDALLPGNSRIRLIGPLPAVSFAAVHVERLAADNIANAYRLLGVSRNATLAELRASYYRVAQDHHPDLVATSDGADTVGAAAYAYKLLKRVRLAGEDGQGGCTFIDIVHPRDSRRWAA